MTIIGKKIDGEQVNTVALDSGLIITMKRVRHGWMVVSINNQKRTELDSELVLYADLWANGDAESSREQYVEDRARDLGMLKEARVG